MRTLLDALQEGRLVELPDSSKAEALEYLALLIEAIPDIGTKTDLVKAVQDREAQFNTGLGKGVAVPHCRVSYDGELLTAIGWSPKGIDYGASDGRKVHLVIMYYVPETLRNAYLKEISGLAKVLQNSDSIDKLSSIPDIQTVRDYLLDWVSQAIDEAVPDAKARMIKLDARQAIIEKTMSHAIETVPSNIARFIPFKLICFGEHHVILTADQTLVDTLEHSDDFGKNINSGTDFYASGYHIAVLSETTFSHNRKMVEAVAYRS
jgi:mannitol/fructose-specific phosphotransferase system IIA component (Ntr-type)